MRYGELMFMLMDKRASGLFLAEILFICCFEDKGQTYTFQVFKRSNTLKIMTIHFFRVSKGGVSNDCYHKIESSRIKGSASNARRSRRASTRPLHDLGVFTQFKHSERMVPETPEHTGEAWRMTARLANDVRATKKRMEAD